MNAVAERIEQNSPVAPANESAALISIISRAASDPNVDIDKMERLLQMQERIMDRNAKAAFTAALAEMQPELPIITERGEIKHGDNKPVQSRYALWEDINEAIRPILHHHGFALSFRTGSEEGKIVVTAVLSHRDGHSEETTIHLPADQSGSKNAVQAVGSSTSYGKRYTALSLLNITTRGQDDDGKAAGASGDTVTDEQRDELLTLISESGADAQLFCRFYKIDAVADLPASRFQSAKAQLLKKKEAK